MAKKVIKDASCKILNYIFGLYKFSQQQKTGKTAMALTWYRHFQGNGGLNQILRRQTS
jgi:hypothetical protein